MLLEEVAVVLLEMEVLEEVRLLVMVQVVMELVEPQLMVLEMVEAVLRVQDYRQIKLVAMVVME